MKFVVGSGVVIVLIGMVERTLFHFPLSVIGSITIMIGITIVGNGLFNSRK